MTEILRPAGTLPYTDAELLGLVDELRGKFTEDAYVLMDEMIDELAKRRVYPVHWPGPKIHARVRGWGAYWHTYKEPLHCPSPSCNADLRDETWGPPGKREIGRVAPFRDRVVEWHCPDCGHRWPA